MKKNILIYLMAITIPLALALMVWQGARYSALRNDVNRLYKVQDEWVEGNKNLITDILQLSSPARIERLAKNRLGLDKKRPEDVTQITIDNE
jgi:cell division protein FtsL